MDFTNLEHDVSIGIFFDDDIEYINGEKYHCTWDLKTIKDENVAVLLFGDKEILRMSPQKLDSFRRMFETLYNKTLNPFTR